MSDVIGPDTVVRFHYSVLDAAAGAALETTAGGEPMAILFGQGGMLPAVQQAMAGHRAGDAFEVDVPAAEAFGPRRDDAVQRVSKKHFADARRLRPGQRTSLQTADGPRPVTVVKVGGKMVDVDTNHPYAGRTLRFAIEVLEVRAATDEERAHGHAHGPGGHHHH